MGALSNPPIVVPQMRIGDIDGGNYLGVETDGTWQLFGDGTTWRDYPNASGEFSDAETSGLAVDAMSADMHRESNTMGSRSEYAK